MVVLLRSVESTEFGRVICPFGKRNQLEVTKTLVTIKLNCYWPGKTSLIRKLVQ